MHNICYENCLLEESCRKLGVYICMVSIYVCTKECMWVLNGNGTQKYDRCLRFNTFATKLEFFTGLRGSIFSGRSNARVHWLYACFNLAKAQRTYPKPRGIILMTFNVACFLSTIILWCFSQRILLNFEHLLSLLVLVFVSKLLV